jgi:hypothetical protein
LLSAGKKKKLKIPNAAVKSTHMKKLCTFIFVIILFGCEKSSSDAKFGTSTGKGGSMARFTIEGNYLYTVDEQDLKVYDITNPASPVFKRTVPVGFEIETIFPFKGKLFIGSTSVVHIFNIDDPTNPQKLSVAISPTVMRRCDPVVAKDTVAFATLRTNGQCGGTNSILAIYDIKDVTNPVQKGSYMLSEPYGLGYEGNTLYVCDKYSLGVFDITNAYQPQFLTSLNDGEYIDVIPYGDVMLCWVADGLIIYDISDNHKPVRLTYIR